MIKSDHIKNIRPDWDQLYYLELSQIISNAVEGKCKEVAININNCRVLDAGCGAGETMQALKEKEFSPIGIDINEGCIKQSSKYGVTVLSSVMELDKKFSKNSFDFVVCSHVLEHLENPKAAMTILKNISSRYILIAVPNLARIANFMVRTPRIVNRGHMMGWDCHHLRTFLEVQCDLKIVNWIQDAVTLPPLRLKNKLFYKSSWLKFLEYKLLPKIMPQQANSLIVLCEI